MSETAHKLISGRSAMGRVPWRHLFFSFFVVLFSLGGCAAAWAESPNEVAGSGGPGLPFAIGDFDGDQRPDVASIQVGRSDCCGSDYWIQLRLSSAGKQSIRVVGPVGGLQIDARDVNGDAALDLVISTAWLKRPVSILLNDGRGNFSVVDPSAFPATFADTGKNWSSGIKPVGQAAAMAPRWRNADGSGTVSVRSGRTVRRLIWALVSESPSVLFSACYSGRAPPSQVSPL